MPRFRKGNFTQHMLVPIELQEQLMPGTIEKTINDLIDRMDMKVFMDRYQNDETGAPAYDPRVLLKIILFAYSRGILSSRKIAQAAEKNITFIALSGYAKPDFTTIANFISSMEQEIMFVFTYVLRVCQRLDLIGGERFALDGHKMSSNASKELSGTFPKFEKKVSKLKAILADLMQQHKNADTEALKESLSERIKKKARTVEKIETFMAENEPKRPTRKSAKEVQSNITDNESAKLMSPHGVLQGYNSLAMSDEKNQIVVAASVSGANHETDTLKPMVEQTQAICQEIGLGENIFAKAELLADNGFASEANVKYLHENNIDAYIPDLMFRRRDPRFADRDRFKTPRKANIFADQRKEKSRGYGATDFAYDKILDQFTCKNGKVLTRWGSSMRGDARYGIKKGECATCSLLLTCMPRAKVGTRKTLTVKTQETNNRNLPYTALMRAKIDSPEGRLIYSRRMKIIEPVFANMTVQKGMHKFTLRGKTKVGIQNLLYYIVHNIGKIATVGAERHCEVVV